ncbi:MAG TPA: NAD(P)H-hydrate dehydratase, partial [Tenuifilaceae bacterium]|nr:NAD(P)H-hydrate dehydratase [Tenuifilaceae bacterium]
MKIFSSEQIRDIDSYTIANEPIASVDLMERASNAIFEWMAQNLSSTKRFIFICGPGNNGGDGLAVARMIYFAGFNASVYYVDSTSYSSDFTINLNRLKKTNIDLKIIIGESDFPLLSHNDIIVDALYGSGLSRPIDGLMAKLVQHINQSGLDVVSIDIPSGLFSNENPYPNNNTIVKAKVCLTLQFPKLSFLFAENEQYVGRWIVLPIGLHPRVIEEKSTQFFYLGSDDIKTILRPRPTFAHKGTYGHCLIVAGSYGMIGAAALCTKAVVSSGSGLVTAHIPKCGYDALQQLVPIAMCKVDSNEYFITDVSELDRYNSICIGPGLGTNPTTVTMLEEIISRAKSSLIIDADALNIISQNKGLLSALPESTIITPHPGEFDRLFGKSTCGLERMKKAIEAARMYKLIVVLKGAHTQIVNSYGCVYFNSTGNAGMATGGSGDVLTGVIGGLLAQGYTPLNAAKMGVYIHGVAGDIAKINFGETSLSAQNIAESL